MEAQKSCVAVSLPRLEFRISSFLNRHGAALVALAGLALTFFPVVAHAQGCAMCYTSASAARAGAKEALANGVLILLAPPMVFFALITVVVYRYRNKFRDTADWRSEHDRELKELLVELAPADGVQGQD
jgi:heme/copper-type cytochrome/quinol oxidase subunit 2